MDFVLE